MAGVLSVATLLVNVAALVATATTEDRSLRRLVWVRRACAAVAGLLVAASVAGLASGFALAVACVAVVLSASAIRLGRHGQAPLETYVDHLTTGGDAAWQAEFERPFDEYVHERAPYS